MARKKTLQYKELYASKKHGRYDNYGRLYVSMFESEKFQNMSINARLLYVICRVQAASQDGKACLFRHGEEHERHYDITRHFVFPAKHKERFGIKDRRNANRWIKELIDNGFIEIVENNQKQRKVTVYAFSDKWQQD